MMINLLYGSPFLSAGLWLQIHPPQQVLEARVVAEGGVCRFYSDLRQTSFVLLVAFLQLLKHLIFLI